MLFGVDKREANDHQSINQSIYLSTLLVHNIRGSVRITDIQMQVGLSDLKMLTGHQGRNKPSLTDAPYIHTVTKVRFRS